MPKLKPPNTFLSEKQLPFSASFEYTSKEPATGKIFLSVDLGNSVADVSSVSYSAIFAKKTFTGTKLETLQKGNVLSLVLFPDENGIVLESGENDFKIDMTVQLSDATKLEFKTPISIVRPIKGISTIIGQIYSPAVKPFIPSKFGFRRLGIADYKKVVAEVCCYREAEVSHIENIMAREFKNKSTTRERIEENTIVTENEVEVENLTDTTTNERFEMQSEVAKVVAQQKQFGAYANIRGNYGKITFETGANYATNTAKEESNRQAVIESKEITQQALERIVTRFREQVTSKITESYKEENSHVFDNRAGENHVSGVYRYINAVYKNQVYNYGKRLMYEFMIPSPSTLHRLGMYTSAKEPNPGIITLEKPNSPMVLGMSNAHFLSEGNYLEFAVLYGAVVEPAPAAFPVIGKAYNGRGVNGSSSFQFNDFKIPEGYKAQYGRFIFSQRKYGNDNMAVDVLIGNNMYAVPKGNNNSAGLFSSYSGSFYFQDSTQYSFEAVPVSVIGWDLGDFVLNLTVNLERTTELYQSWQIKTFDTIMAAYHERLTEYNNQQLENQNTTSLTLEANPLFFREIEQITLKKNCISYLMKEGVMGSIDVVNNATFTTFKVPQTLQNDNYSSLARFMEQAFEWNLMSYNFYPYYWGFKKNWSQLYQTESDDKIFREFMQAGMARVMVTVRPGFEDAVMHYMATGQIWNGGQVPVLGDPLYMSIVDELKEQEYVVEETWETVVPTSLTALQKSGVAVDAEGLPCGGGCEDGVNPLKPNDNKLGPELPA